MGEWTGYKVFTVTLKNGKQVSAEIEGTLTWDDALLMHILYDDSPSPKDEPKTELSVALTVPTTDLEYWDKDDSGKELTEEDRIEAGPLLLETSKKFDWEEKAADEAAAERERRAED